MQSPCTLEGKLLSDASEFMTGQVIYLDGGLTAKLGPLSAPPKGRE